MLTPSFDVSQSESSVTVTLRVPYVKISEAEVHIEGRDFKFYCRPYFLHLQLPGELAPEDKQKLESTTYDTDTGTMTIRVLKRHHGEHFDNLEMLTTLLPRKGKSPKELREVGVKPGIEVLEPRACAEGCVVSEEGEEFDWSVEQKFSSGEDEQQDPGGLLSGLVSYGFALQQQGVFVKLQEEIPSIVDCPDPDHMTPHQRRIGRLAHENTSFSEDHYLADLMDNDQIKNLLDFSPPWKPQVSKWRHEAADCGKKGEPGPDLIPFSTAERDQLKSLKNTEYILDKATRRSLYLGLVDIVFAYAYNFRSTEGESNVESAWTICKLSSTLSWLEVFRGAVHEVVYSSLRRSLCYPLYRHWALSMAVLQDTRELFRLGRRKLLQCVLDVRAILNSSDPYYILNNLYITDYAIWLQKASVKSIQSLADELDEVKVERESLGWELVELEEAALLTLQEEEEEAAGGQGSTQQTIQGAENPPPQEQGDVELVAKQLQEVTVGGKGLLIEELQEEAGESSESETESTTGSDSTTSVSDEDDAVSTCATSSSTDSSECVANSSQGRNDNDQLTAVT